VSVGTRAIRRIGETFEVDRQRKALVVMASGAGKTRTVIALVDVLMRCNWAKRILFLADCVALVNQAVTAFKKHLPDSSPVNLVTEKNAACGVARFIDRLLCFELIAGRREAAQIRLSVPYRPLAPVLR
jgi:type I site-specific restriction endonuclease